MRKLGLLLLALPNGIAKAGQTTNKFGVGRIKLIKQASDPEFIGGLTQNFLPSRSRWAKPLLLIAVVMLSFAAGQTTPDAALQGQLKRVFPNATAFSPKQPGPPPHFIAYSGDPLSKTVAGYVFWTTELEPLERGYDGPIKMLVGVDTNGILTGVLVTEHREPYGYFSVDLPQFARQFFGKNIRDPFKVGADVDAVSRATITITSSARAIRNGARRVARTLMTPAGTTR
jgi:NosR/NirI family nitrous oxide reductase transcriptional regulator